MEIGDRIYLIANQLNVGVDTAGEVMRVLLADKNPSDSSYSSMH